MRLLALISGVIAVIVLALYAIGSGWFGDRWQAASPTPVPRPTDNLEEARNTQTLARQYLKVDGSKQVLFGDLHVHSTFSIDAFFMSLPSAGGDGLHPVSDACDFARYCSAIDFFSINDHAETLSIERWRNTIDEIRQCNAVADTDDPDLVAFLGWEWTQAGLNAETHYGHKNVIIKGLADKDIPTRPISSLAAPGSPPPNLNRPPALVTGAVALAHGGRQELLASVAEFRGLSPCKSGIPVRNLPDDCIEAVATPAELFAKLDDWDMETMVIPHGTTWGMYTPPGSSWDKQLAGDNHDPARQRLLEIYSGHGNSEEFRSFSEVIKSPDGSLTCPEPSSGHVPGCWRAGEIIYERCLKEGLSARDCNDHAAEARANYLAAPFNAGDKTVPGATRADWLDAGQCLDCWLPAFNYRPNSSAQYILATGFKFGFIASSDNHSARPGTGYKEFARDAQTEARFDALPDVQLPPFRPAKPAVKSIPIMEAPASPFVSWNFERAGSWFLSGGLVAVHASSRQRGDIWDALQRQEVYATSGPRILLWFNLESEAGQLPMGSDVTTGETPKFIVKALGSFEQQPGCPTFTGDALTRDRVQQLCNGECYNPSEVRRPITRIEVVRIRPRIEPNESIASLVEDPWKVIECPTDQYGCEVEFTDPDFPLTGRDSVYYVRALEAPSLAVGAEPYMCDRDSAGNCTNLRDMCADDSDDCLAPTEERAWSSPIYLTHQ